MKRFFSNGTVQTVVAFVFQMATLIFAAGGLWSKVDSIERAVGICEDRLARIEGVLMTEHNEGK